MSSQRTPFSPDPFSFLSPPAPPASGGINSLLDYLNPPPPEPGSPADIAQQVRRINCELKQITCRLARLERRLG